MNYFVPVLIRENGYFLSFICSNFDNRSGSARTSNFSHLSLIKI